MADQRFQIRIDRVWQPLLLVGAATPSTSYVELRDGEMEVRFGVFYRQTIPLDEIESASEIHWPWFMGVGWRTNFTGQYGLIGSYQGVVELRLRESHRVLGLLRYRRLAISLEEPQAFLAAIGQPVAG